MREHLSIHILIRLKQDICALHWSDVYFATSELLKYQQGLNTKTKSVITDENVQQKFKMELRAQMDESRCPKTFKLMLDVSDYYFDTVCRFFKHPGNMRWCTVYELISNLLWHFDEVVHFVCTAIEMAL